jgi:hypothetical protein
VPIDTYGKRASKVATECSIWLRNVVKITDPNKPFYSHRHTPTSYLRNTRLPDGSPAVKEDVERYIQRDACWLWQAVVRNTEGGGRRHPEPRSRVL